jgi:hypothetical protein
MNIENFISTEEVTCLEVKVTIPKHGDPLITRPDWTSQEMQGSLSPNETRKAEEIKAA